jgi:hypothetical protein
MGHVVLFTKKNGDTTDPEEVMTKALEKSSLTAALFPLNFKTSGIRYKIQDVPSAKLELHRHESTTHSAKTGTGRYATCNHWKIHSNKA